MTKLGHQNRFALGGPVKPINAIGPNHMHRLTTTLLKQHFVYRNDDESWTLSGVRFSVLFLRFVYLFITFRFLWVCFYDFFHFGIRDRMN